MVKGIKNTAVLVLGGGTLSYLYHKSKRDTLLHAKQGQDEPTYCEGTPPIRGKAAVPKEVAKEGPLILKLKQVCVIFRHGARTPLHLVPKLTEANYERQFIMREHQASLYPYERISCITGQPIDWSEYEQIPLKTTLKSGVNAASLTAYGKDQLYMLGKTLQTCYMDSLNLATYDPKEVFVMSSNIRRTVESARCALAGFFGKQQLKAFSQMCFPVRIFVTEEDYNVLVPNTISCDVLRKVNYTSMFNSDSIPGFKETRLVIENKINKERGKNLNSVKEIQEKINLLCESSKLDESLKGKVREKNEHNQLYLRNPLLHPLVEERSTAITKVGRLWTDAMVRNDYLSQVITEIDMKALIYLRRLEVERFDGKFRSGYRFHFYFEPNPYFYNDHLCKEVYLNSPRSAQPSWSIPIVWKESVNLLPDIDAKKKSVCPSGTKGNSDTKRSDEGKKVSFFHWYTQPTCEQQDRIGKAIRDEVWNDPIKSLEGKRKHLDSWDRSFNFLAARDDTVSRLVHGIAPHEQLDEFEKIINTNATLMLYFSMNGQTSADRCIIPRLSAGPLLTTVVNVMDDIIKEKKCAPKLVLYASHDSTMTGLLEALGIWDNQWPPFACDIRFELYKDVNSSEHYVRILYCGEIKRIRNQQADYLHWGDLKNNVSRFLIQKEEYKCICCSDLLERSGKGIYIDERPQHK